MEKPEFEYVGQRIARTDAAAQVSGSCVYGEDLYRPGMLVAKACFSQYAHAKILDIQTRRAESMPGVQAVITWKDVPFNRNGCGFYGTLDQPVLADTHVRYRGDCVAVVAAQTREQAEAAVGAIEVTYEPLPAVMDIDEALAPQAPLVHPELLDSNVAYHLKAYLGDVEVGFAQSDVVVEASYRTQKVEHVSLETHVALAEIEPDGKLVVTTSTSRVFNYARILGEILKLPMSRMQIKAPPGIGGGFGGKNEVTIEPWVALLALRTGRAVKMVLTRDEEFRMSTVRHAYTLHYKTGVMRDGTLQAQQITAYADTGAYLALGKSQLQKCVVHACGPYRIPHIKNDGYLVLTNTVVASAMRGMGMPQACFACESHMDMVAQRLGIHPLALRRKNLFEAYGTIPNGQLVWSEPLAMTLERALQMHAGGEGWK